MTVTNNMLFQVPIITDSPTFSIFGRIDKISSSLYLISSLSTTNSSIYLYLYNVNADGSHSCISNYVLTSLTDLDTQYDIAISDSNNFWVGYSRGTTTITFYVQHFSIDINNQIVLDSSFYSFGGGGTLALQEISLCAFSASKVLATVYTYVSTPSAKFEARTLIYNAGSVTSGAVNTIYTSTTTMTQANSLYNPSLAKLSSTSILYSYPRVNSTVPRVGLITLNDLTNVLTTSLENDSTLYYPTTIAAASDRIILKAFSTTKAVLFATYGNYSQTQIIDIGGSLTFNTKYTDRHDNLTQIDSNTVIFNGSAGFQLAKLNGSAFIFGSYYKKVLPYGSDGYYLCALTNQLLLGMLSTTTKNLIAYNIDATNLTIKLTTNTCGGVVEALSVTSGHVEINTITISGDSTFNSAPICLFICNTGSTPTYENLIRTYTPAYNGAESTELNINLKGKPIIVEAGKSLFLMTNPSSSNYLTASGFGIVET
jgi:hypothetical protein